MSPIVARSVASLYGCKPNLKKLTCFRSVCYTILGASPITETTGIILACFDGKHT